MRELPPRKVHADRQRSFGSVDPLPALHLNAGFKEHPLADVNDGTCFLGHRYEPIRSDRAALGMLPPNQRLKTDKPASLEFDDRLILDEKLVSIDRATQVCLELQQVHRVGVHALVEYD